MGNLNIEKIFILIKKNVYCKVVFYDFDDSFILKYLIENY